MHQNHTRNINPNHLHGCHPLDLHSIFGAHTFHLTPKKPKAIPPQISRRLRLLEKIQNDISHEDLPAKDHLADIFAGSIVTTASPIP